MERRDFAIFGKPYLSFNDDNVFLNCDVFMNNETKTFWFKYDKKFEKYLVTESIEAFVLSFLPFCMKRNINIKSQHPINEVFKYQIEEYLMPALVRNIKSYNQIEILAPVNNEKYQGKGVAVGISCGVDSTYTILKNYKTHSQESGLNIDFVTFFNAGSSGSTENGYALFKKRLKQVNEAAEYLGLELIVVDTNINSLYVGFDYESVHSYRTLSIPLTLQKLFSRYYYSSSFAFENFKFDDKDPTYHDMLTMSCVSTPSLTFTVVGGEVTRIDKIKFVSKFNFSKRFLNVCVRKENNCSKCFKCMRTMLELYLIGKLDDYNEVFDVKRFYTHFDEYIVYAIEHRQDIDMPEIYEQLCLKKIIKHKHRRIVQFNSFKRKILGTFIGRIYENAKKKNNN